MHCSTAFGKMLAPLLMAVVQNMLTNVSCHCTFENMPCHTGVHLRNSNALHHSSRKLCAPLLRAVVVNRLTSVWCHCKYTYEDLPLHTGVQSGNSNAVQRCF